MSETFVSRSRPDGCIDWLVSKGVDMESTSTRVSERIEWELLEAGEFEALAEYKLRNIFGKAHRSSPLTYDYFDMWFDWPLEDLHQLGPAALAPKFVLGEKKDFQRPRFFTNWMGQDLEAMRCKTCLHPAKRCRCPTRALGSLLKNKLAPPVSREQNCARFQGFWRMTCSEFANGNSELRQVTGMDGDTVDAGSESLYSEEVDICKARRTSYNVVAKRPAFVSVNPAPSSVPDISECICGKTFGRTSWWTAERKGKVLQHFNTCWADMGATSKARTKAKNALMHNAGGILG